MKEIFVEYRYAIIFLAVFIGIYVLLNTAYGFLVETFLPTADPLTTSVANHVSVLLSFFHSDIKMTVVEGSKYVPLYLTNLPVIDVYEGCNGANVMIVYIAFICAYRGNIKSTVVFLILGICIIHLANLFRVSLLFEIALYYPDSLYFFHKYLFTAFLYIIVFIMWFFWVRHVKSAE